MHGAHDVCSDNKEGGVGGEAIGGEANVWGVNSIGAEICVTIPTSGGRSLGMVTQIAAPPA